MNKMDFLFLYLQAHIDIFTEQTVQSGFEATELILYKPEKVLSKLQILTSSLFNTSHGSQSSWTSQILKNLTKMQRQSTRFKNWIQNCTESLFNSTNQFLNKLFANYEKVIVNYYYYYSSFKVCAVNDYDTYLTKQDLLNT